MCNHQLSSFKTFSSPHKNISHPPYLHLLVTSNLLPVSRFACSGYVTYEEAYNTLCDLLCLTSFGVILIVERVQREWTISLFFNLISALEFKRTSFPCSLHDYTLQMVWRSVGRALHTEWCLTKLGERDPGGVHCFLDCYPNPEAASLPFCRRTASTVSITSRPSIRSSVPSELTCSPPSPEDEFQRSLPAKAPVWENGCVRMVFTMEGFLQHHMQPQCKTFLSCLWDQDLAYLIRINLVVVHFCNGPRRVVQVLSLIDEGLFYSQVERKATEQRNWAMSRWSLTINPCFLFGF